MDKITIIVTLVSSILGGLVGGLFTYLGVRLTIRHEDAIKTREKLEKLNFYKPRLDIKNITRYDNCINLEKKENLIEVIHLEILKIKDKGKPYFEYSTKALDNKNLKCVEYELKNIGKTEIEAITISTSLLNSACLYDYNYREIIIKEGLLEYAYDYEDNYIKPGETIFLRIYTLKDQKENIIGKPTIKIWLWDVNRNIWKQSLYTQYDKLFISEYSSLKECKANTNVKESLEELKLEFKKMRGK